MIASNLPYILQLGVSALLFFTLTGIVASVITLSYNGTRVDDIIAYFVLFDFTMLIV